MREHSEKFLKRIGIECEALEGPTWGMGRQIHRLLVHLAARTELRDTYRFVLYSNNPMPADALYDNPLFIRRPTGMKPMFGSWAPSSFSLYYYILLPLRLWRDRLIEGLRAVYHPNYMLPIGSPPGSLVMLTDDIFREAYNPILPFKYRLAYRIFATGWAKLFATRIMAISHASAITLEAIGIPRSRIAVNELGVDAPAPVSGDATPVDFLFVGQALPRRHLKESLEAFARIARDRPTLTFRFIGTDKYPQATIGALVERVNRNLGRTAVTWDSHYVNEEMLASAYRSAGTLVYISDTEGFGMPPVEALSYGTPPIVADTPVSREIFGDFAFLVRVPIDDEGIEEAMRRALDDTDARARTLKAGPAIAARYNWDIHARRWLDIMNSIA